MVGIDCNSDILLGAVVQATASSEMSYNHIDPPTSGPTSDSVLRDIVQSHRSSYRIDCNSNSQSLLRAVVQAIDSTY
jgi:hypothetical protein